MNKDMENKQLAEDVKAMKEAVKNTKIKKTRCSECGAFIYHGKNCSLKDKADK